MVCRGGDICAAGREIAAAHADQAAAVERGRVLRIDDERGLVIRERLVEEMLPKVNRGAALESKLSARLQVDRSRDVLNREIVEADQLVTETAVVMRESHARIRFDDTGEIGNGLGEAAEDGEGDAAIAIRVAQ